MCLSTCLPAGQPAWVHSCLYARLHQCMCPCHMSAPVLVRVAKSMCVSVCRFFGCLYSLPACLSDCLSICRSACLPAWRPVSLSSCPCLTVCLPVRLSVRSVCLCLSVRPVCVCVHCVLSCPALSSVSHHQYICLSLCLFVSSCPCASVRLCLFASPVIYVGDSVGMYRPVYAGSCAALQCSSSCLWRLVRMTRSG